MNSNFLNLNILDVVKGFILAIITAFLASLYQILQNGTIDFTWLFWKPIVFSAIGGGLAYLIKNVFTNSDGVPFKKEL